MEFIPLSLKEDDSIPTRTMNYTNRVVQPDNFFNDEVQPCPECGSTKRIVDNQRAEVSCACCGIVLDENIMDRGPEWRAFDHEQRDRRARTGAPSTYTISDKGLTTTIDYKNVDYNGRKIPERNRTQMYRLRKWNKRLRISRSGERNLALALSELDNMSSGLGNPRNAREDAAIIYRNAAKNNLVRGRSIESVVAASIYTACRRCNIPRTLDEVSEVSNVPKKQIGKNYRFLSRKLNIKLEPTSPVDYIPRFASKLGLSGVVQARAIEIIHEARENGLNSGKAPTGLAAAALYIASIFSCERKTQKDIAVVVNVTEVTIRNRYKELSEKLNFEGTF